MKYLCLSISSLLNFIFGFLFGYALFWLLITFYGVDCLINSCSDMVGEEWGTIILGLMITLIISGILLPTFIFTNRKFLRVVKIRKKYYSLFISLFFVFGIMYTFKVESYWPVLNDYCGEIYNGNF
ncbi:hypothetical protein SAMN04488574_11839 [Bacillus sp. 71mf]|nr:hypothetical protein SAMN04488574_11839 [Bacillus sp. 71mf]SFS68733.1 hypothetical protein SAMN04488145_102495 [Bacillus sp. 103mf]